MEDFRQEGNSLSMILNVDQSKATRIRHTILGHFPFFAFDEVLITEDAGYMPHYKLAERIWFIPVVCNAQSLDEFRKIPEEEMIFNLGVYNEEDEIRTVTQFDLKNEDFERHFSFSEKPIPIYELKKGQRLTLTAVLKKKDGNEHAKYKITSLVSVYLEVPLPVTHEKLIEERRKYPFFDFISNDIVTFDRETGVRNPPKEHFTKTYHNIEPQTAPFRMKIQLLPKINGNVVRDFILEFLE